MHVAVAYLALSVPWVGKQRHATLQRKVASGAKDARLKYYQSTPTHQAIAIGLIVALGLPGSLHSRDLGLVFPRPNINRRSRSGGFHPVGFHERTSPNGRNRRTIDAEDCRTTAPAIRQRAALVQRFEYRRRHFRGARMSRLPFLLSPKVFSALRTSHDCRNFRRSLRIWVPLPRPARNRVKAYWDLSWRHYTRKRQSSGTRCNSRRD
jgi:hypothetical protein